MKAIFTAHLRATASDKTVFTMLYLLESVLHYNKKFLEECDKKLAKQSWIFNHQAYFIKAYGGKDRDWFQQSISDQTFKNLLRWKSTFVREEKVNSSKKGQKQIGERSIDGMMVRIIAKEKNNK